MSKYIHQYTLRKRFVTRLGVARASAGGGARPEQQTLLLGAALCVLARGLPQQALPALVPQPPLHLPLRLPQHLLQPCLQHLPNQNRLYLIISYEIRCGTHRCGVSSTDGYECIHTIPYDGCDSHTVIFPPSERARISFVEISRIAPQFAVRRSRHEMQPNAIHI